MDEITTRPIGRVERSGDSIWLQVDEVWRPALLGLDGYSHLIVIWCFDQQSRRFSQGPKELQLERESGPIGLFATRTPHRPNPIALSVVRILGLDLEAGRVEIDGIEAFDGTALLDLKGYSPKIDSVPDAVAPNWGGSGHGGKHGPTCRKGSSNG